MRTILFCLILCFFNSKGKCQKPLFRLVASAEYNVYTDSFGNEARLPGDSVHYGYSADRGNKIKATIYSEYSSSPWMADYGDTIAIRPEKFDTMMEFSADSFSRIVTKKTINSFDQKNNLIKSTKQYWGVNDVKPSISETLYWYNEQNQLRIEMSKKDNKLIRSNYTEYDNKGRIAMNCYFEDDRVEETKHLIFDTTYLHYGDSAGYSITYSSSRSIENAKNYTGTSKDLFKYKNHDLVLHKKYSLDSKTNDWVIVDNDSLIYSNHKLVNWFSPSNTTGHMRKQGLWSYNNNGLPWRRSFTHTYNFPNEDPYPLPNGMRYLPNNMRPVKVQYETLYYYQPYYQRPDSKVRNPDNRKGTSKKSR